jgi:hypothetical protein
MTYQINKTLIENDEFKKGLIELLKIKANDLETALSGGDVFAILRETTQYVSIMVTARSLSLDTREYDNYVSKMSKELNELGIEINLNK